MVQKPRKGCLSKSNPNACNSFAMSSAEGIDTIPHYRNDYKTYCYTPINKFIIPK